MALFRAATVATKINGGLATPTRSQPLLGLVEGPRGPTQIHIRGLCYWAGEPSGHLSAPSHRADEPPGPQAPGNKPALYTLMARIVPGAVRECDVPVPPCSVFRLLSSFSYSNAWPFAVAKATQVFTRNRTNPVAV